MTVPSGKSVHVFGPSDGWPLLALHGVRGHGLRWRRLAETELPDFRVHAPDLRGHGFAPQEPPWTFEQHAADAVTLLDSLGLSTVDVVGHSLGAAIGAHLSHWAPGRVRRLVMLDPGIGIDPAVAGLLAQRQLAEYTFAEPAQAAAARAASWPEAAHHLIDEELTDHLVRGDDDRWRWRFNVAAAVTSYSELARPAVVPTVPTLLVVASNGVVRPEYVQACKDTLGDDLTVVELEGGHHVHLELPSRIGELIRDFCHRRVGGS